MHASTRKKAEVIRAIVDQYYEPGRQDRCKLWVYRNIVARQTGISERTFFRYLNIDEPQSDNRRMPVQLSLF